MGLTRGKVREDHEQRIYSATTGKINRSRALDVTASNLATPHSRLQRDRLITSSFRRARTYRGQHGYG
jgi:hypothetical protein